MKTIKKKYKYIAIVIAIGTVVAGSITAFAASQTSTISTGSIIMDDKVSIYTEDIEYLKDEINRLLSEVSEVKVD